MNILANTRLHFLNIGKYGGIYTETDDFSSNPRPFFSIGMILNGTGRFCEQNSECAAVSPGDIIIVPNAATYISHWEGNPHISYITFHFLPENDFWGNIPIQKISGLNYLTKDFQNAYNDFSIPEKSFGVLGVFYNILNEVSSRLKYSSQKPFRASVKNAVDYITLNYAKNITIHDLAEIANLSQSRFFSVFKNETGTTPIEYKNQICIRNAKKMLLTEDFSIEEISEKLGFNSTSYFRRTFKKYTKQSPSDYKKSIKSDFKL